MRRRRALRRVSSLPLYLLDRFIVAVSPYTMRRRIASGREGASG
jgi:hypothetical protein